MQELLGTASGINGGETRVSITYQRSEAKHRVIPTTFKRSVRETRSDSEELVRQQRFVWTVTCNKTVAQSFASSSKLTVRLIKVGFIAMCT